MSRNYKMYNPDGIYFISFAVVGWLDVFTKSLYKDILVDSLIYCQKQKGLLIFSWCIMTNHVHLIIKSNGIVDLPDIIRDMKKFTSRKIIQAISDNPRENRKKMFLEFFNKEGIRNCNNTKFQFWRQDNRPVELWSNSVIDQKIEYIHDNPVKACIVLRAEDYLYSSAMSFANEGGLIEIDEI